MTDLSLATELSRVVCVLLALSREQECMDTADIRTYTPWSIKKRATFIFSITLANIDGFS